MHDRASRVSGARAKGVALCNAVSAWIEAGDFERAQRGVERAQTIADETRDSYVGGRALWQKRDICHRATGTPPPRDEEVLRAIRSATVEAVRCKSLEVEAVAAWRRGDADAASLAAEAAASYAVLGQSASGALMRALELSIRGDGPDGDLEEWSSACRGYPPLELQALQLLVRFVPEEKSDRWQARIDELADCVRGTPNNRRLEVLTVAECLVRGANKGESQ